VLVFATFFFASPSAGARVCHWAVSAAATAVRKYPDPPGPSLMTPKPSAQPAVQPAVQQSVWRRARCGRSMAGPAAPASAATRSGRPFSCHDPPLSSGGAGVGARTDGKRSPRQGRNCGSTTSAASYGSVGALGRGSSTVPLARDHAGYGAADPASSTDATTLASRLARPAGGGVIEPGSTSAHRTGSLGGGSGVTLRTPMTSPRSLNSGMTGVPSHGCSAVR